MSGCSNDALISRGGGGGGGGGNPSRHSTCTSASQAATSRSRAENRLHRWTVCPNPRGRGKNWNLILKLDFGPVPSLCSGSPPRHASTKVNNASNVRVLYFSLKLPRETRLALAPALFSSLSHFSLHTRAPAD